MTDDQLPIGRVSNTRCLKIQCFYKLLLEKIGENLNLFFFLKECLTLKQNFIVVNYRRMLKNTRTSLHIKVMYWNVIAVFVYTNELYCKHVFANSKKAVRLGNKKNLKRRSSAITTLRPVLA